ncbi:MAG: hypothetical protein HZA11_09220 [Nitrospirae bacterium]|nr:hypothetical protein [Nitrospirota bacterium]
MKKYKISLLVVMVFCFSLFGTNTLAGAPNPPLPIADDSILSQHIKEADETTGQDTNTGSGIKTGHIQDGAVTTPKIVDGAVSTSKITDGAVTDAKITGPISGSKLGTHTHSGSDIADGSVATSKIAAGAITPDKIGFYSNAIIVAPSGGDFTSPVNAINAITDASASNLYLVKIMPGVYTLSDNAFMRIPPYVDIEGSGKGTTIINGNGIMLHYYPPSTTRNAELRNITITGQHGPADGYGRLIQVSSGKLSIFNADINSISPVMQGLKPPPCVSVDDSTVILNNVNCSVSGLSVAGMHMTGTSTLKVLNSSIVTSSTAPDNINWNNVVLVQSYAVNNVIMVNSLLTAGINTVTYNGDVSNVKLVNCYDGNYNSIPNR